MTAIKQPRKRDLDVLEPGTPRSKVVAELGAPVMTDQRQGRVMDVFSFRQGYAKTTKTARALFHGTASAATLGLWEVLGTPTEGVFDGREIQLEVYYDSMGRVEFVEPLNSGVKPKRLKHRPPPEARLPVQPAPPAEALPMEEPQPEFPEDPAF